MNRKLLLLGGSGFLGSGLIRELNETYPNIKYKIIDKVLPKNTDFKITSENYSCYDLTMFNNLEHCINDFWDITDVVILASNLGIDLFNSDKAEIAGKQNMYINDFVLSAVKAASKKYNKSFNIIYYSTSELFGNNTSFKYIFNRDKKIHLICEDPITPNSSYNILTHHNRKIYSEVKLNAEKEWYKLAAEHPEIVNKVIILRPFNIFGKYQTRGVAYKMLKDALTNYVIYYNYNTIRTLTSLTYASKVSLDIILNYNSGSYNIVDDRCCMTMEFLAYLIKYFVENDSNTAKRLNQNINLIKTPQDTIMTSRVVSQMGNSQHNVAFDINEQRLLPNSTQYYNVFKSIYDICKKDFNDLSYSI